VPPSAPGPVQASILSRLTELAAPEAPHHPPRPRATPVEWVEAVGLEPEWPRPGPPARRPHPHPTRLPGHRNEGEPLTSSDSR
jgi:hypothetical protein